MPLQQSGHLENMTIGTPSSTNYCAAAITLCFQLFSAHYTVSQTKDSVRIISAISPFTTENTDVSRLHTYCREAMHRATSNRHLGLSAKRNGTQRRTKVSLCCVHCTYCGMPKGMSRVEATSNSENLSP